MNTRSLENERMRGRDREKGCTKAKEREAENGRAAKTRKEKKGKTERQTVTDKKNSRKTSDMHMTTHLIPLIAHALTHLS